MNSSGSFSSRTKASHHGIISGVIFFGAHVPCTIAILLSMDEDLIKGEEFMRPIMLLFFALALALGAPAAHAAPFAYIPHTQSNTLSVIDTATNTAVATVAVAGSQVAVNPAGTR